MKALKDVTTLCVHDGCFHADEVLAGAFVQNYNSNIKIIRTRNPQIIANSDLAVDVGGGELDHHSFDKKRRRNNIPYCGVSLLLKQYQKELGIDNMLMRKMEEDFLIYVDGMDNGVNMLNPEIGINTLITLPILIMFFNSYNKDEFSRNGQYTSAVRLCKEFLSNYTRGTIVEPDESVVIDKLLSHIYQSINYSEATKKSAKTVIMNSLMHKEAQKYKELLGIEYNIPTLDFVLKYISSDYIYKLLAEVILSYCEEYSESFEYIQDIVELALLNGTDYIYTQTYSPFAQRIINELDEKGKINWIIYRNESEKGYCVSGVNKNYQRFEAKKYFPAEWSKYTDEKLKEVSGIQGLVFSHTGNTFIVISSNLSDVLKGIACSK